MKYYFSLMCRSKKPTKFVKDLGCSNASIYSTIALNLPPRVHSKPIKTNDLVKNPWHCWKLIWEQGRWDWTGTSAPWPSSSTRRGRQRSPTPSTLKKGLHMGYVGKWWWQQGSSSCYTAKMTQEFLAAETRASFQVGLFSEVTTMQP